MLPVVLYECETWSVTLGEEYRLSVFENGLPRKIFGPKRTEVTGNWRRLHNEVKVKFALQQAMKAQRRSRGIALLFL